MKYVQSGFTFVELMIVIVVGGFLAVVAVPAYQDYMTRSDLRDVLAYSASAQLAVTDTAATLGALVSVTAANSFYAFPGATEHVGGISIADRTGVITIRSTVPNAKGILLLSPTEVTPGTGQLTWACTAPSNSIPAKYLPPECRN